MAECLDETFAGLRIERTHLGRRSLGGFVALCTAADRLDRASWLALLARSASRRCSCRASCCGVFRSSSAPSPQRRFAAGSVDRGAGRIARTDRRTSSLVDAGGPRHEPSGADRRVSVVFGQADEVIVVVEGPSAAGGGHLRCIWHRRRVLFQGPSGSGRPRGRVVTSPSSGPTPTRRDGPRRCAWRPKPGSRYATPTRSSSTTTSASCGSASLRSASCAPRFEQPERPC